MKLSELIDIMQMKKRDLPPAMLEAAVRRVFREITDRLAEGGRVELRGFGAFEVRKREARAARNPKTGESIDIVEKNAVYFRPGKAISEALREKVRT